MACCVATRCAALQRGVQDGDAIALYKSMRDCLIFLTNLDYEDTESIMLEKLKLQVRMHAVFASVCV